MDFNGYSDDQLRNMRTILDEMQVHAARINGCFEAINLLYPLGNLDEWHSLRQRYANVYTASGAPFAAALGQMSRGVTNELERRKEKR